MRENERTTALTHYLQTFFSLASAAILTGCVAVPPMAPRETVDYSIPDGSLLSMLPGKEEHIRHNVNASEGSIEDYQVARDFYVTNSEVDHLGRWKYHHQVPRNTVVAIIRKFTQSGAEVALAVNATTLQTYLIDPALYNRHARPARQEEIEATNFHKTLTQSAAKVFDRVNDIVTEKSAFSFILTIDMCQSTRQWDRDLFESLIRLSSVIGKPVEVGVAITGKWALWQPENFRVLKSWAANRHLSITWINHSMNHPLRRDRQGRYHFLTDPSLDFNNDVLSLEVFLLENGVTPSVWFRFPGLVFDRQTLQSLNALSLLPLDATAWLAKTQRISDGSIVLVHGNGNEPVGLKYLAAELTAREDGVIDGNAKILPVADAAPFLPNRKFDLVSGW